MYIETKVSWNLPPNYGPKYVAKEKWGENLHQIDWKSSEMINVDVYTIPQPFYPTIHCTGVRARIGVVLDNSIRGEDFFFPLFLSVPLTPNYFTNSG
jgi:hypothetical protein